MPEARADTDHAANFYAAAEPDLELDLEFLAEVRRVALLVGERPLAWTEIEPGVRRAVLRRFPYALIYVVEPDEVLILAVAHQRRRAGHWRDRRRDRLLTPLDQWDVKEPRLDNVETGLLDQARKPRRQAPGQPG